MILQSMPYPASSAASWLGALAHKNANQSSGGGAALTWQINDYDYGGWHSTVTNTERFVVSSGVSLIRATANRQNNDNAQNTIENRLSIGGAAAAAFIGQGKAENTTGHINCASAPIAVSAGDYVTAYVTSTSGTNNVSTENWSWAAVEVLNPLTRYCIAYHNAAQTWTATTNSQLAFNSEVIDTSGFHDTVTNNSRLSVPSGSGITLVRLTGNIHTDASQAAGNIIKNGAAAAGLPSNSTGTTGNDHINLFSAPIEVAAGTDYFQFNVYAGGSPPGTISGSNATWFAIEEVIEGPNYKRALAVLTGAAQTTVAATPLAVAWNGADVYDTGSMHDPASNNTKIYVPSGCTRARPSASIRFTNTSANCRVFVRKNGADYYGMPYQMESYDGIGIDDVAVAGAWVDCVPGDYFECYVQQSSAGSVAVDPRTWFCLECE